jgi:aspartyl-tRNA(Asn)/glutamyl-tRNA(Gln) amidotransferase subunit A
MNDLHWMTLVEAAGAIAARKLSPVELMSALLERIGRLDPKLNVFIRLDGEAAMEEASAAEAEIVSGRLRGPLHGVPVGIKDIIDVAGLPTTCHSKILIDNVATADAVCVSRLRGAGAIVLGKLSTHEFAIGGPSFDLPWPPARNPWNTDHHPGGSRPRDQGLALLPACSRWRWAVIQAAACVTRPAPAASSGSSRLTVWFRVVASSRSPSRSTTSDR